MKNIRLLALAGVFSLLACNNRHQGVERPKIVVGIVIDQMRWDYLYRYYERYGHSGFRRLLNKGYNCQQTHINYLPTYTAPGHACVYTGSVPAIHGIAGNDWVDRSGNAMYCVRDTTVAMTEETKDGPMSPANLLTTTVTDELRLATNFKSRVYGVALKDRGSILPAGHLANAAYWFNDLTGNFVSSSYYTNPNPDWLKAFNNRHIADSFVNEGWYPLYNADTYKQSVADSNRWEGAYKWETAATFPHLFNKLEGEKRHAAVKSIPGGNSLTLMMAKACIDGERLGTGDATDFLTISLSSTDYVGHRYAPNSMEAEDTYLRLDRDIANLLLFLDKQYGRNGYLLFLTADHGGAHNAGYLTDHGVPAGVGMRVKEDLNTYLQQVFGIDGLVVYTDNYQICYNEALIAGSGKDREVIRATTMAWLEARPEVANVIDLENIWRSTVPEPLRTMAINGYHNKRSGGIQMVLNPGWYGSEHITGTTHGTWNPYDSHIPLIWYGWNIMPGETNEPVHMTDIAPTVATLLHIQMPNGCVGKPIRLTPRTKNNSSRTGL